MSSSAWSPSRPSGAAASSTSSVIHTSVGVRLDRAELLLLVSSALSSLGCVETVRALRRETGITSEQRAVERVRAAVLAGEWQQASNKCHKLLMVEGSRQGRQRQQVVTSRVSAMLHAGRFLDQLHAAVESQQPPVEALTTLTQHIATLQLTRQTGQDGREAGVEDSDSDSGGSDSKADEPVSFVELCDRWLPSASSSSSPSTARLPRLSSLLCVLSSLLLCCSVGELSLRSGCDVSSRAWRPLLADRIIDCLPRASAVPHNQLANMLAIAAITASHHSQHSQQQQQTHQHQHSQLQQYASHLQPAATDIGGVDVSLLAAPAQSMSVRSTAPPTHARNTTRHITYISRSK